jgi:hypothetical protein
LLRRCSVFWLLFQFTRPEGWVLAVPLWAGLGGVGLGPIYPLVVDRVHRLHYPISKQKTKMQLHYRTTPFHVVQHFCLKKVWFNIFFMLGKQNFEDLACY